MKQLAAPADHRAYLPAIEPERQVTDWGRSERVEGLMDRTVYDFLYHYWFRVEVEGIEHVPSTGGALLVSNHAGALPPDASMIAKAIKEEHSRPRPLHMTVEHFFKGYPWLSMLVPKIGGVPAHPANVHRLLYDEEQLVLVFPEGAKGTEKLYKDRYRLRRFGRGGFVEAAMRAKAPIVPVAVVGAEEAQPIFAHLPLRRLTGLTLRAAGAARLPAGEVLHPLPRADPDRRLRRGAVAGRRPRADARRGGPRPDPGGALRDARAGGVPRGSGEARPHHRPLDATGAAGSRRSSRRIRRSTRSSASRPRIRRSRSSGPSSSASAPSTRLLRRIVHAAEIDTVVDTRLVVDSRGARPRDAHEQNVIGTMNVLAACGGPDSPVRKVVFKSSAHYYGCERDDPSFFTEDMRRPHPPRTRLESDIVEADDAVQGFAGRNPGVTVSTLRFCNGLGPDLRTTHTELLALPAVPGILGFDPRYQFIHEDDIVGALRHAVVSDLPGIYNAAPDGVLVLSEVASLLGKPYLPLLPPWGTGPAAAALGLAGLRFPEEVRGQLRYGRGLDNRRLKQAGYRFQLTSREAVQAFAEALRLAPLRESAGAPYRYEREVEEFLRWSPSVRRGGEN